MSRTHASRQPIGFAVLVLGLAACVNVVAAVILVMRDPGRASDLETVSQWCRAWLLGGESLYTAADALTDYPPNAIVLLSPLALVRPRWLVPGWTLIGLALTPLLPWLIVRSASRKAPPIASAIPILLYLCWAAPRTLLQFSVLSLTLASVAALAVDARPVTAGVLLGLALFKPHIAGPIALWMAISGRLRSLAVAAVVVVAGVVVYDARIAESPLVTVAGWVQVIGSEYGGPDGFIGRTSIRGWTRLAVRDGATADAIWFAASFLLLLVVCALAMRDRLRALQNGGVAIPAMFCLWSLLVTYHNGNNLILMLPAFAFLWADAQRQSTWSPWVPILIVEATLAFDVPVRLTDAAFNSGWVRIAVEQFDRILVLAVLVYVSAVWVRLTSTSDAGSLSGRPEGLHTPHRVGRPEGLHYATAVGQA